MLRTQPHQLPWPPTSTSPIPHAPTDEGVVQVNWGSSSMNLTRYCRPSQMMELLFWSLVISTFI
ncbi:hypothetical protein AMELA_G00176920 [Ameiurus melas]|uniref:Uncharacterized protein n=1 Tax=Ameiurus melas TaxID=219545 RepID=A0A7J6AD74_AMEME|nr:hypothetical protein AMELA_G00176920 [Ameiurus melas]